MKLYYLQWGQNLYFKGSKYIYPKTIIFKAKDVLFFSEFEFFEQLIFYKIIIKRRQFFGGQTKDQHRFAHFIPYNVLTVSIKQ